MSGDSIALIAFVVLFALMALRVPVGIAMGAVGVVGFAAVNATEPARALLGIVPLRTGNDYDLALIPMFILMGSLATASGLSRELFRASNAWLGHLRGGLAIATIAACGGFAAICGSSVATAATMARVALPEMRRFGYSDKLATGVIAAGGTLGILIPPSIVLAIYGFMTQQDIGRLFIAGIVPGILAVLLYIFTVSLIGWLNPKDVPVGEKASWQERKRSMLDVWGVLALFVFIIGGIYAGIFTAVEAAAMGAVGAWLIGILRKRLDWPSTMACLVESLRTSAGIFMVLVGAFLFGYFLAITQAPAHFSEWMLGLQLGKYGTMVVILLAYLALGCVMDAMAMIILTIPIFFPIVQQLGFDPIWFGVVIVMTVELGLITPPVGMNVYVINGVARDVSLVTIFRGVAPFVLTDIVRLAILVAFPVIVTFLPSLMS
ncbi:MAG: TRAP transporter large permease [Rhodospirillales bacterium]